MLSNYGTKLFTKLWGKILTQIMGQNGLSSNKIVCHTMDHSRNTSNEMKPQSPIVTETMLWYLTHWLPVIFNISKNIDCDHTYERNLLNRLSQRNERLSGSLKQELREVLNW